METNYGLAAIAMAILMTACSGNRIQHALQFSGNNRPELEKVLKHYRESGDPEKYAAAEFLISNMPGHKSMHGNFIPSIRQQMCRSAWKISLQGHYAI